MVSKELQSAPSFLNRKSTSAAISFSVLLFLISLIILFNTFFAIHAEVLIADNSSGYFITLKLSISPKIGTSRVAIRPAKSSAPLTVMWPDSKPTRFKERRVIILLIF